MRSALVLSSLFAALSASAQSPQPRMPEGVIAHRDLVYVEGGHERHKLDLYLPSESKKPLPLILWVHGGGWQNGSKEGAPPLRAGYVQRGYAVASINYRLSGHAVFPAQIEDCKAAIRWLRAHAGEYGIDPQHFGVWGSSAGGHLAALIGTSNDVKEFDVGANLDQSSRVQAVCDYYGPTDFKVFVSTPGYESHAAADSPEARLIGGAVMQNLDKAARVNPITYVSKDDPPFLIVHGDKDPTVPINQSQLLFESLKKTGVSVHFHTIHGAGHGGPGFAGQNIDDMVAAFFEARLMKHGDAMDASTSESEADPELMKREPRTKRPIPGRPQVRGIPWEVIARRDDKDGDGKVTKEEFSGLPALFQRLDTNGDGVITPEDRAENTPPPKDKQSAAPVLPGFKLDGERWTCREGDFAMEGILVKPEGDGPFPAMLISHGLGGNAEGFGMSKAREMVRWGMVCIAPNYTHTGANAGGDRSQFGASAENLRRAQNCLQILRSLPYVDDKRLSAYGHSMGGFVTIALAASSPDALRAAAITGSGIAPREAYPSPTADEAAKIRTPFLMLHGANDTTVRPEQSEALKRLLDDQHVPNDRLIADGQGHPIDQTMRDKVFRLVREWWVKHGVLQP